MLRKLASYPRQNGLAFARREIGRIERPLFLIDWLLDPAMRAASSKESAMTQEQKVTHAKTGIPELARQLGNVSQACPKTALKSAIFAHPPKTENPRHPFFGVRLSRGSEDPVLEGAGIFGLWAGSGMRAGPSGRQVRWYARNGLEQRLDIVGREPDAPRC
ncbi:MAG: hypothetical protein PPHEESC_6081, partial [uncultured Paraburkholderia sp.]